MNDVSDKRNFKLETSLLLSGFDYICGIDEAGRGSLSGPVVAAACILNPEAIPKGIKDSKQLSPSERVRLFYTLKEKTLDWAIGIIDNRKIDELNILEATKLAMAQAVNKLILKPDYLLIDAVKLDSLKINQKSYIKGDVEVISISAASIIAKVCRDEIMSNYHNLYPRYNWKSNKGYPTREHLQALAEYGPSEFHRYTFKGVS